MESSGFDQGDEVVVHRESAQRAAERATVVGVGHDDRLRVEFPDGHRSTWAVDQVTAVSQA